MEVKQLEGFVLLLVMLGLIIGVGILVLDKFSIAVKDSTSINETITFTNSVGVTVQGTTANDDVTSITSIINGTGTRATYVSTSYNFTTAGIINLDPIPTIILNETITFVGGTIDAVYTNITSVESVANKTKDYTSWINTGINWTTAGVFTSNASFTTGELQINYTFDWISLGKHDVTYFYDKDSTSTTTVGYVNTSIGIIASTWLPLIVTIVILSIILTLVIRSFVTKR